LRKNVLLDQKKKEDDKKNKQTRKAHKNKDHARVVKAKRAEKAKSSEPHSGKRKRDDKKETAKTDKKKAKKNQRTTLQELIEKPMLAQIKKTNLLAGYLSSRFSLRSHQYPHAMKF